MALLSRKQKIVALVIVILIIILALLLYLYLTKYQGLVLPFQNNNQNTNLNEAPPVIPTPLPTTFNQPNAAVVADVQAQSGETVVNDEVQRQALFTARAFAERFGTYSNQSGYLNFDELAVFMTTSMQTWVKTYKEDLKKQNPDSQTYYALQTKSISQEVQSMDEKAGLSDVLVKTQRQEFKGDATTPRVYYQDILLKLVLVDKEWKVNGAYWQK